MSSAVPTRSGGNEHESDGVRAVDRNSVAHRTTPAPLPRPHRLFGGAEVLSENGEWVDAAYEAAIQYETTMLQVRQEARKRFQKEQEPLPAFDIGTLGEILARDPEPTPRIERFLPASAMLLIIATRKTGKTTLVLNLIRSLLSGEPFLGHLEVQAIGERRRVAILNFEVSSATFAKWAAESGIPHDRLVVVNLRGKRNPFTSAEDLEMLGAELRRREVESLVVDVFGKAFDGDDENSNSQVRGFLLKLDRWARDVVEASDVILTAHAGKSGDSARGASELEGTPDSFAYLTRVGDGPTAVRYLRAEGRDVDFSQQALAYDSETRILSIAGSGSQKDANHAEALEQIERLLRDAGAPMSGRQVAAAVTGKIAKNEVARVLEYGEEEGRLEWQRGPRGAQMWSLVSSPVGETFTVSL